MDIVINGIIYRPVAQTLPKDLTLGQYLKATRKALRIATRIANTYGIGLDEMAQYLMNATLRKGKKC